VIGAVDIGGDKIAVGMVDDTGRVLVETGVVPTNAAAAMCTDFRDMIDILRKTEAGLGHGDFGNRNRIHRSGLSRERRVWRCGICCRDGREIIRWKIWRVSFNGTVALENDADASALGEAAWGGWKSEIKIGST